MEHHLEAARQRPERLEHRDVERDAGHRQPCARLVEARVHRREEARHIAVLDHDALGFAGRAGGVDHIGQVLRPHARLRVCDGICIETVERRDDRGETRVFDHVREPFFRIGGVQRHVGRACFEDPEHRGDQVGRAIHEEAHQRARRDTLADQPMRELVRPGVQSRVADLLAAPDECGGLGSPPHLRLERVMHAEIAPRHRLAVIPLAKQQLLLLAGEDGQLADRFVAALQIAEERRELPFHPRHGARVEDVVPVPECQVAAVVRNDDGQLRVARRGRKRRHALDRDRGGRFVPAAHRRAGAGIPLRNVQRVGAALPERRELFEQVAPERVERRPAVDADLKRNGLCKNA